MNRGVWTAVGCGVAVIAALILGSRTSYQPGLLIEAHAQLASDCTACHRPWRGPSSAGCIDCHGDIADNNPHGTVGATEADTGLIPGKRLAALTPLNNLSCLSCHSEHQGRTVDISVTAGFACTFCHKHNAIGVVPEHAAAPMKRQFFARHLFKQIFDHYRHRLLITSAYPPRPEGFNCISCHSVEPVKPGRPDQMSFKWSGCAGIGCHLAPQDSFMRMPAPVGASPTAIAYSGVFPMRHIKAVFTHSPGHLRSACQECHLRVDTSRNPDDSASLAIMRCFTCHAHQPVTGVKAAAASAGNASASGLAFAAPPSANVPPAPERSVVACLDCHLFHAYGVVPTRDFPNPAPKFPPNARPHVAFVVYVPHLRSAALAGVGVKPVQVSPWWLGLIAFAAVAVGLLSFVRILPRKTAPQEAVSGVAPQRAKEVPAIDDTYQTNIRQLYIVGEAAGTASINLAMRSGRQVIEAVANELRKIQPPVEPEVCDVVIVGCGPAGLGATATARAAGLKYVTLEKMTPASTLRSYPRAKFVQATPIDIAEYGSFFLEGDNSREELIKLWDKVIAQAGLVINDHEEVVDVRRDQDCFLVRTARGNVFRTRCVVLAIGVRGNPRHLNLPGETSGRVFYNLIEPGEFRNRKILVVGGGNAGCEVAQALAAPELGNTVSYSFRSPVLTNVTRENAERISALQQSKAITLHPSSALKEIRAASVVLEPVKGRAAALSPGSQAVGPVEIGNDVIFAMIGAELPTGFLKSIGIRMVSKGR
jgi:thioredoxin reductase (NADPH)